MPGRCGGEQVAPQPCLDDADWCCPSSAYRFAFLVQKALELANEVRNLGSALLSAYEKGDAEYLASLRATQEQQLLTLTLETRQDQWREAAFQARLTKNKRVLKHFCRFFEILIEHGLIGNEEQYRALTGVSRDVRTSCTRGCWPESVCS